MAANPVARMIVAGLLCLLAVCAVTGGRSLAAALLGMGAPLVVAVSSWLMLERRHRRDPSQVSGLLIKLFGAKMMLFGAYIAMLVPVLPDGRMVFVVSFVSHYVLLHLMEALSLRRLFAVGPLEGRPVGVS